MNRSIRRQTVLVADDSLTVRMEIRDLLEAHGYEVCLVRNGRECLDFLEEEMPDLVLLDLVMPEIDGIEVCKRVKSAERTMEIPVLLLTAAGDIEDKVRGLKAGAEDYLTKPFEEAELLARIASHLRIKELIYQLHEEIDERKKTEFELQEAKEKAEEANRSKSDFLARMSHEIRTPMNAIIGFSELTHRTELTPKQSDYLKGIRDSARSLLGIIDDILDFSKIEAGKLSMESVDFDLRDALDNMASMVGLRAEEKGLELLFSIDPHTPHHLIGDSLRLGQVLINLGNNAVKFTEQGEIVVRTKLLETDGEDVCLQISVSDTGIGISAEQKKNLFQAFTQADGSITRKFGGTGLGLVICKRLVEMMGGTISLESEEGKGSTFAFTAYFKRQAQPKERPPVPAVDLNGLRALVVDDNAAARKIFKEMLTTFGIDATSVASGKEALARLASATEEKKPYHVVLLDWQMPDMNGVEVAKAIRAAETGIKTRIIMISAYCRDDLREDTRDVQIDGLLVKPVFPSRLLDALQTKEPGQVCRQQETEQEGFQKLRGVRTLLVEDNEFNKKLAIELLTDAGMQVRVADNGLVALELLQKETFDVVLMDVQMPVMDGYGATRRIREQEKYSSLPIIAMTASAIMGDREKCLSAGMNDYISKPIDSREMFSVISRWIVSADQESQAISSEPVEVHDLPDCLPGIDIRYGLSRIDNNMQLYRRILVSFNKDQCDIVDQMQAALDQSDTQTVERLAHTLKGIGGTIGAKGLQVAAEMVERLLKEDVEDLSVLNSGLGLLEMEIARVLESSAEIIQQEQVPAVSTNAVQAGEPQAISSEIKALLAEIAVKIEENDMAAVDLLEENGESFLPLEKYTQFSEVRERLAEFDFKDAGRAMQMLLGKLDA
jgi:CheY-like chemotaxis protein